MIPFPPYFKNHPAWEGICKNSSAIHCPSAPAFLAVRDLLWFRYQFFALHLAGAVNPSLECTEAKHQVMPLSTAALADYFHPLPRHLFQQSSAELLHLKFCQMFTSFFFFLVTNSNILNAQWLFKYVSQFEYCYPFLARMWHHLWSQ